MAFFRSASLSLLLALPLLAAAQESSSSSSNPSAQPAQESPRPAAGPARLGGVDPAGSAISLEVSEALFNIGAGLNACGYDADLDNSAPVRLQVREELNAAIASSAQAQDARDKLCTFVREHTLGDATHNLSQYVSLGLYLNPPPELTPIVEEGELPPDAAQLINLLPLLRAFAESTRLHLIWVKYRPQYEEMVTRIHEPLTKMVLNTNIYLHLPVSSYDGRRFIVFLEPLLAPAAINARIYGSDYVVVASPKNDLASEVRIDEIRHTYLHYTVEPMIYTRPIAVERLTPILKTVQDAPLDFVYKNDTTALVTECMIKAIEARTMDVGFSKPKRPAQIKQRNEIERYEAEVADYERRAEAVRQQLVARDLRMGYVLTSYLYGKLVFIEHDGVALKDNIGEIVYAMDIDGERKRAQQIQFFPEGTREFVARGPARQPKGMDLAEMKLIKGDTAGAEELAQKAVEADANDPRAHYMLARIAVMGRDPSEAVDQFTQVLKLSKDPRTLAWSHIYLGRLYDTQQQPDRAKAVAEYKAALAVRDSRPDTKTAAEEGLKKPFALPKREGAKEEDDDGPIDPTGKAEKEAYRPSTPRK